MEQGPRPDDVLVMTSKRPLAVACSWRARRASGHGSKCVRRNVLAEAAPNAWWTALVIRQVVNKSCIFPLNLALVFKARIHDRSLNSPWPATLTLSTLQPG